MSEQTYMETTPARGNNSMDVTQTPAPFYGQGKSDVQREIPKIDESRKAFVQSLLDNIKTDLRCWEKAFKRMHWDMRFVAGRNQYPNQKEDDDRYMVNLTYRHVRNRTSAIYAKNPTPDFEVREKLRYVVWDGKAETLVQAAQLMAQPQGQDPMQVALAQEIITEAAAGVRYMDMLGRVGKTMVILIKYFMDEQEPSFKRGMKRMVRRGKSMGIGYVRLGFKRVTGQEPGVEQGLLDMKRRMQHLEALRADMMDKENEPYSKEAEELRQMIDALMKRPEVVLREGLTFDNPHSLDVIPHAACTQLDGFLGADWVTVRHPMAPKKVQELYKVDLKRQFTAYTPRKEGWGYNATYSAGADGMKSGEIKDNSVAMVFEHYHRKSGLMYTLCDGYPDYLAPPEEPVTDLERFYPIFCYVPNEVDLDDDIYPLSDTQLLKHVQQEYNRTRNALRNHRYANRPVYVSPDYAFPVTDDDEGDPMVSLKDARDHEIIKVAGLDKGQDPATLISPLKKAPIDPAAYEVSSIYSDAERAVGSQATDFGGTSGDTATEVATARETRKVDDNDDADALDMVLGDLFRAAGQVMLKEITPETAKEIAGPGAVWPRLSRKQISEEIFLKIQGGSSGRPNEAMQVANIERLAPYLLQIPGLQPGWIAQFMAKLLDPNVDIADAVAEGLPSIQAMNGMMKLQGAPGAGLGGAGGGPGSGNPESDPTQQGDEGGQNQEQPMQGNQGAQPQFPQGRPQLRAV
ncbi:MAG: hypothetical protein E6R03_12505 [Hyphomicrobiaceae bacterium]|nr:MAG: hypothetical protein E6R03_12505 [Hyphomicrobiaceae bacterium]